MLTEEERKAALTAAINWPKDIASTAWYSDGESGTERSQRRVQNYFDEGG